MTPLTATGILPKQMDRTAAIIAVRKLRANSREPAVKGYRVAEIAVVGVDVFA